MSAELQIGRPGESAHWYTRAGDAAYEVPKKGGGLRPATLRDARKLDLLPSVTSIMSIKTKWQLVNWMIRQAVLSVYTLPPVEGESEEQFFKRVEQDRQAQGREAAEEGTRIHAAIEMSLLGEPVDAIYFEHVFAARKALKSIDPEARWLPEKSFASPLGYAGKVDLHAPATTRHPDGIVADFKTKDFADGDKMTAYDDWGIQNAAYANGLGMPEADRYNIVISRNHPGAVWVHTWQRDTQANHLEQFTCMLRLWQLDRRYEP